MCTRLKTQPFGSTGYPAQFEVIKSVTLQCTDMLNGNNKFYQLELHQSGNSYRVYSCYGRTGCPGVQEERVTSDKFDAETEFDRIKKEKTSARKGYHEVKMAVTAKGTDIGNSKVLSSDVKAPIAITVTKESLEPSVAKLVTRLYKEAGEACQSQLSGSLKTTVQNPLGTLTLGQIKVGEDILNNIESYLKSGPKDALDPKIIDLSNEFFAAVPQQIPIRPRDEYGRRSWLRRYCINDQSKLDTKKELLELLADVQGVITGFDSSDLSVKYKELQCAFKKASDEDFEKIRKYVTSTQGSNHYWNMQVKTVWTIQSQSQAAHSQTMDKVGNIKELFHGSKDENILGISKKGLLIRPAGVATTGAAFGNGIYFANCSTKSGQYSTTFSSKGKDSDTHFMFVANVALGKMRVCKSGYEVTSAPPGYDSVMGAKGGVLIHDEFIIYDKKQNQLSYLIEFNRLDK